LGKQGKRQRREEKPGKVLEAPTGFFVKEETGRSAYSVGLNHEGYFY
jgi:hypothetical protein